MPPDLAAFHLDLRFMAPLSEERATELVDFVSQSLDGTVVDVGCGWAELLIRILEATPGANGIGIDLKPGSIEHAQAVARTRGVADRITLIEGDAKDRLPASAQAAICIGASQIWGPPVEAKLPLDYHGALKAVRSMLERGAPVIYGEGIWASAPTAAAIAPLAGRLDEYVTLPDLLDIAIACGFEVIRAHEASLDEWDAFESGFVARYARWLATHPADHPEAQGVRESAARQRAAYFRGYRGILGMAYLQMLAV
ncbi:MAG TPA: class I SAM-dependent methyltransferase [Casimicrobiaceae bacterium]|nr:class I SAM-dependent methyltransferase [Casimicrobiaceae bacterium]